MEPNGESLKNLFKIAIHFILWNNKHSPLKLFYGNNFREVRVNFEFIRSFGRKWEMNCRYSSVKSRAKYISRYFIFISFDFLKSGIQNIGQIQINNRWHRVFKNMIQTQKFSNHPSSLVSRKFETCDIMFIDCKFIPIDDKEKLQ